MRFRCKRFFTRQTAGSKLIMLCGVSLALFFIDNSGLLAGFGAATIALYRLAGFSWRALARRLQPAALLALLLFIGQFFAADAATALRAGLRLFALLGLAALVTATTTSSALLAAMEQALRRLAPLGLKPRPTALALALAVRFIPLTRQIWRDIAAAQQARGGGKFSLARGGLVTGLLLTRLAAMQDNIAQAIEARGFDEEERENS